MYDVAGIQIVSISKKQQTKHLKSAEVSFWSIN